MTLRTVLTTLILALAALAIAQTVPSIDYSNWLTRQLGGDAVVCPDELIQAEGAAANGACFFLNIQAGLARGSFDVEIGAYEGFQWATEWETYEEQGVRMSYRSLNVSNGDTVEFYLFEVGEDRQLVFIVAS